jgi:hypothetical protein
MTDRASTKTDKAAFEKNWKRDKPISYNLKSISNLPTFVKYTFLIKIRFNSLLGKYV